MPPSPAPAHRLSPVNHDGPRGLYLVGLRRGPARAGRAGRRLAAGAAQGEAGAGRARAGAAAMTPRKMTPKRWRLWLVVGSLSVLGAAAALVLTALNDNIVFFYS